MVKKKTILTDSFEQVAELGKTTAKRTAQTVKDIALDTGTAKTLEQLIGSQPSTKAEKLNGNNHTPLDMNNLNQKYQEQDKQKEASLKARLFQLSRQGEVEIVAKRKQQKQQKEQQILQEEEDKKKEESKKQQVQGDIPKGKQRRSIFSPVKKAREQHAETRPASGKQ